MSSEPRRKLRWWQVLLIVLALITVLIYLGSYTLVPRDSSSSGLAVSARE